MINYFGDMLTWSIKITSVILVVMILRGLLKGKIKATYQCTIWLIVIVRLLVPQLPASSLSLFNLWHQGEPVKMVQAQLDKNQQMGEDEEELKLPVSKMIHESHGVKETEKALHMSTIESVHKWLKVIWLIGSLGLVTYFAYCFKCMKKELEALSVVEDRETYEILERCKQKAGVRANIKIVRGKNSMIFGMSHPIIVIPLECTHKELELILVHELMHYKYKDYVMNYVQIIVLCIHWYNPFVWLAMREMKEDMELACDERVLALKVSRKCYAETLLKMSQLTPVEMHFAQGMGGSHKMVKKRITQIAAFKKAKLWTSMLGIILIAVLSVGCLTNAVSEEKPQVEASEKVQEDLKQPLQNVAILGLDKDGVRPDTIIVATIDSKNKSLKLTSIPRDTKVILDDAQKQIINEKSGKAPEQCKLNELLAYAGMENINEIMLKEIEKILGVQVDHYITVNLKEAEALVDQLGGIDIEVLQDMCYQDYEQDLDINLKAGKQHLNGKQTLDFVRFRHDSEYQVLLKDGDIGRIRNTQQVIKKLSEKLTDIHSIEEFTKVVQIITKSAETNISLEDLTAYYTMFNDIDFKQIQCITVSGETIREEGRWYYVIDKSAEKKL